MRDVLEVSQVRIAVRIVLPVLILVACAFVLRDKLSVEMVLRLPAQLAHVSAVQWGLAGLLTLGSFAAVAQYDMSAHKALKTEIAAPKARISGVVGIALGQTLGFGLITGALARWRVLPELCLPDALRLSAFVSLTFVASWALLSALVCLLFPAPDWTFWPSVSAIAVVPCVAMALFWWPDLSMAGRRFPLPSLPLATAILGWALMDTAFAAGALFTLLPQGVVPFTTFFPLFLIALGSGLISNTPGGVGPFELVLLTGLPLADPAPLLAAILGYRVIYYALPAAIAALVLLRPFKAKRRFVQTRAPKLCNAPRSEVGVIRQNGGHILTSGTSAVAAWPTGQTLTMLADPLVGPDGDALHALRTAASKAGQVPVLYKCGPRLATAARATGWRVLHMADDAVVDVRNFGLDAPARRTLRRKLRCADKAGVVVRSGPPVPDVAMARVDQEWQAAHGRARGGSMGRYCATYVQDQWVGCAYINGHLVGFATAHRAKNEWCLDIMRHTASAPDGTMHALVHAGIKAAHRAGAQHFSLASTPACPDPASPFWRWAAFHISTHAGGSGLRQFKSSFAPVWVPRYAAARNWATLAFGLADISRAIHRPAALAAPTTNTPHEKDENYEVASSRAA